MRGVCYQSELRYLGLGWHFVVMPFVVKQVMACTENWSMRGEEYWLKTWSYGGD